MLGRGHDLSFVWASARYVPYDSDFFFVYTVHKQMLPLWSSVYVHWFVPKDVWYRGARSTSTLSVLSGSDVYVSCESSSMHQGQPLLTALLIADSRRQVPFASFEGRCSLSISSPLLSLAVPTQPQFPPLPMPNRLPLPPLVASTMGCAPDSATKTTQ